MVFNYPPFVRAVFFIYIRRILGISERNESSEDTTNTISDRISEIAESDHSITEITGILELESSPRISLIVEISELESSPRISPIVVLFDSVSQIQRRGHLSLMLIWVSSSLGGLLCGYELGQSSNFLQNDYVLHKFLHSLYMKKEHFGTYYCATSPFPLQAIPIVWYIVLIFSSFGSRSICRIFGWRIVFRFLSIFILLGAFVSMTSSDVYIFILGRVFASIGIGLASQVIPRYNTEIAFSKRRKIVDVVFQVSVLFGVALGNILNDMATEWPWGWRMLVGFEGVPAIPLIIVSFLIIDPPKSYMERGITELAKASLISLRGSRLGVLEFSTIIQQVIDSESDFKLIMSSRYRPHLIIAIFSQVLNICSGSMVIVLLMPETVLNLGYLTESVLWNSIVMSSSTIVGAILTLFLVGRIGRRIMTMTFFFFAGFSMALLGIILLIFMKPGATLERPLGICATILMCFVMCGSSATLGPRGWMSEGFPPSMDWVGSIASSCTNLFLTLVLAQVTVLALCYIRGWVFIIFCVFNLLGGFFVYLFLPETTGRSSGIELSKHRIWRRYVQNDEIGV